MPIIFDNTPSTGDKHQLGATYPDHVIGTNEAAQRCEPLLTPELLKSRHLFGIPLASPLTKEKITDEMLKDQIVRAVNQAELDSKLNIWPVQYKQKAPFDRSLYISWCHLQMPHSPIQSVQSLTITTADGQQVFKMPTQWIEPNNFFKGLISVIPISPAFAAMGVQASGAQGGAVFLTFLGQLGFIPAYWQLVYVCGFDDKALPVVVNELVGVIAAQNVLSMLGATRMVTSHSLGADGLSQGVSTPGPGVFQQRMAELEAKRVNLLAKLKTLYGHNFFVSNV
jgi:hypothetical protein